MDQKLMTYLKKKQFYDYVIVEIQRAYTRSSFVPEVGDFNAPLKSNLQNVSQKGQLVEQVINDFNMKVANTFPYLKVSELK